MLAPDPLGMRAQKVRLAKTMPHFSTWQEERDAELECAPAGLCWSCLHSVHARAAGQLARCPARPGTQDDLVSTLQRALLRQPCTCSTACLCGCVPAELSLRRQKCCLEASHPAERPPTAGSRHAVRREMAVQSARERAEELSLEHRARGASQYRLANIMAKYMEDIDEEVLPGWSYTCCSWGSAVRSGWPAPRQGTCSTTSGRRRPRSGSEPGAGAAGLRAAAGQHQGQVHGGRR